jgi:predicted RNA-binding protein with EMAP domain
MNDRKKMKEVLKELSISVASLLDDDGYIVEDHVCDIEHIQDLVTKLENIVDPVN